MPPERWNADQAVAAAPSRSFRGTVWRVHWREVAPTDWSLSLGSSGRYHRGLDLFSADQAFPALYTSLAPEIAIWEMVRRSAARNLGYLRNNVLSELEVDLSRILDISDAAAVGLTAADLTGPDHQPSQELAAAAMARLPGAVACRISASSAASDERSNNSDRTEVDRSSRSPLCATSTTPGTSSVRPLTTSWYAARSVTGSPTSLLVCTRTAASLPSAADAGPHVTLWRPAAGGHVGFPCGRWPAHVRAMPEQVTGWLIEHRRA